MRHGRLSRVIAAAAVVLLLAGCDLRPRGFTTEVDEQRLAALLAEPWFAGGSSRVGGDPDTSANATMGRGEVSVGYGPWGDGVDASAEETWRISVDMFDAIRAEGWSITRVECTVDERAGFERASIVALKDLGGFTAALEASTALGGSRLTGLVPYHDEAPNPWRPSTPLETGVSCLELPEAPAATSVLGGEDNLERAYLPGVNG